MLFSRILFKLFGSFGGFMFRSNIKLLGGTLGVLWVHLLFSKWDRGTICAPRGAQGTLVRNKVTHPETLWVSFFVNVLIFRKKSFSGCLGFAVFLLGGRGGRGQGEGGNFESPLALHSQGSHAIHTRLCSRNAIFDFLHFSESNSPKSPFKGPRC